MESHQQSYIYVCQHAFLNNVGYLLIVIIIGQVSIRISLLYVAFYFYVRRCVRYPRSWRKDRLCPFNDIPSLINFLAAYIIICSYTPSKPPLTFHFNPLSRTAIGSIQFPAKHNSHSYYQLAVTYLCMYLHSYVTYKGGVGIERVAEGQTTQVGQVGNYVHTSYVANQRTRVRCNKRPGGTATVRLSLLIRLQGSARPAKVHY